MARAAASTQWDHTCAIVATIANVNRKKGAKAITPESIHPMKAARSKTKLNRDNVHLLKALAGRVEDES